MTDQPSSDRKVISGAFFRERKQAVRFTTEPPPPPPEPVCHPAHVAKMLALAHHLVTAIERGVVSDRAAVARKLGLTRARGADHAAPRPDPARARRADAHPGARGRRWRRATSRAAAPGRRRGRDVASTAGGVGEADGGAFDTDGYAARSAFHGFGMSCCWRYFVIVLGSNPVASEAARCVE